MSWSLFAELESGRRIAGRDVPALTPDTGSMQQHDPRNADSEVAEVKASLTTLT